MILKTRLYAAAAIPCSQREEGALDDPALLKGSIATRDIYPGKQLTRSNVPVFSESPSRRRCAQEATPNSPYG